jgi:hypothetical protein
MNNTMRSIDLTKVDNKRRGPYREERQGDMAVLVSHQEPQ